jgi:hypothetical protein
MKNYIFRLFSSCKAGQIKNTTVFCTLHKNYAIIYLETKYYYIDNNEVSKRCPTSNATNPYGEHGMSNLY